MEQYQRTVAGKIEGHNHFRCELAETVVSVGFVGSYPAVKLHASGLSSPWQLLQKGVYKNSKEHWTVLEDSC